MTAVALETESATCELRRFNKKYPSCVVENDLCFPPALDFLKGELEPSREPPAIPILVVAKLALHALASLLSGNASFLSQFRSAVISLSVGACVIV